jgi:hypothetical protein
VGSGCTSGVISSDSQTFSLGHLESENVGGACGAPDRGGIGKN